MLLLARIAPNVALVVIGKQVRAERYMERFRLIFFRRMGRHRHRSYRLAKSGFVQPRSRLTASKPSQRYDGQRR